MPLSAAQRRPQGRAEVWHCEHCGGLNEACHTPSKACRIDAEFVTHRLERAGATLLAMRTRSPYPAPYRCAWPEVVRDIYDVWDWKEPAGSFDNRPAVPSAAAVSSMERTFEWLAMIPNDRFVVRRIVGIRSLVHPATHRHVVHWRPLGATLRCSHEAARQWHGQGIGLIVDSLLLRSG